MGAKDSKPSIISYEDAVKRVSDSELRRIREAFKRCAGTNGTALSSWAFEHEVLCDAVPYEVAEWLFQGCGGTKRGIAFRELLCGIVLLTKGTIDEKIKFLWTLYINYSDNDTYMYKKDFLIRHNIENRFMRREDWHEHEHQKDIITSLFEDSEKVTFDQYRSWVLKHKDASVLSKWLLKGWVNAAQELETPTFYQSLAGVTHLEEKDIIELEKCFWSLRAAAPTGQLDVESLSPLLSPPLPRAAVAGAFNAFDENRDGHVDFKELCCGLSAACRGPHTERLKFIFKIFDLDRDGVLNEKEIVDMVAILCTVADESNKINSRASTPSDSNYSEGTEKSLDPEVILVNLRDKLVTAPKRKATFLLGPTATESDGASLTVTQVPDAGIIGSEMALTMEDFLIWSVESASSLVSPFLELVFEVCHVVLGLRPVCKHHERDIVLGCLRRAERRGYSVGQFWYLVSAEWWAAWRAQSGAAPCCRARDEGDGGSTSASSESMGSLLYRAETASLGSATSSGVSSAAPRRHTPCHPGPVRNTHLIHTNTLKVRTLTGEGGHLRRDIPLAQHRDFELLPDGLWRAIALWYGALDPLPRQVIRPPNMEVELELYPLQIMLLRHVATQQSPRGPQGSRGPQGPQGPRGPSALSLYSSVPAAPHRQLAYTAAFSRLATLSQVCEFLCSALGLSREHMRLWSVSPNGDTCLLDDDRPTLHSLQMADGDTLLIEVRNKDLTWPEEIGSLSMAGGSGRATERRDTLIAPNLPGATGLHNLGNTCFMNAALQAVWNTGPLTRYFNSGMHLYELNTTNPLGTGGALALRFGELCKEVWSCSARSVAPLRVRWAVSRHARHLAGGGQHDAQELLAWLIDALHEDLNRAGGGEGEGAEAGAGAATADNGDSTGKTDQALAGEAWRQHSSRNQSILTELFYGQLKSKVRCDSCGHESVRFDTYNMLSLPLPVERCVTRELRVILLDGSVPVKYAVRVNSDGTYLDLKNKLSELCGLEPEHMFLAEVSGGQMSRVIEDGERVGSAPCDLITVYQLPSPPGGDPSVDYHLIPERQQQTAASWAGEGEEGEEEVGEGEEARGEVSDAPSRSHSRALCMPALLCLKRSFSGAASPRASGSPRHASGTGTAHIYLRETNSSPTLSVKSLNVEPPSPQLDKVKKHYRSLNNSSDVPRKTIWRRPPSKRVNYMVAVHRKQTRSDVYFLPSQRCRPALFGEPLVVCVGAGLTGRELYDRVWTQVARLLSARPPQDAPNHATDCDDSLGYEFPFTLRLVSSSGMWCGWCGFWRQCRGCVLPSDDVPLVFGTAGGDMSSEEVRQRAFRSSEERDAGALLNGVCSGTLPHSNRTSPPGELNNLDLSVLRPWPHSPCGDDGVMIAVDWDPTALHLRYQSTREKEHVEHGSVRALGARPRPVDLASCLTWFTRSERLEAPYRCARCRGATRATKTMQIWRAPPIMVIHLKRFQYVNNKWIKSQKVVNFPFEDFDPTAYLAAVPRETVLRSAELGGGGGGGAISESDSDGDETGTGSSAKRKPRPSSGRRRSSLEPRGRQRLESTSLETSPVSDDNLVDYHHHRLKPDQDPFTLHYRLYAVVSHSGQLSGGHYVTYARNPSGTWLCYNDSMCRELPKEETLDPSAAYLLFYERQGLDYDSYLPDVTGREPVIRDTDSLDPDENDLRKMCSIA